MTLTEAKRQFLEYIEIERGRSALTVRNYDHYLSRFIDWLERDSISDITPDAVRTFRLWLNRQSNGKTGVDAQTLKKKTQNYHLIALRAFLKYLRKIGERCIDPEIIELAKTGERSIDIISANDVRRILEAPDVTTLSGKRDKAILELLFSTGLRVSELCALNRDSIDITHDEFSVRGKGDKVRLVFLSNEARDALRIYTKARDDMDEALFVQYGKASQNLALRGGDMRLTVRSVQRILHTYAIRAGVSGKVTPHVMRHAFATDLLRNGADIRSVQALLGHASINTTQVYTHVTDAHLRDIHKKFHDTGEDLFQN